jgi:uncharacterized protein
VKVAVTGSSGLIGSAVSAELRSRGDEVLRLVRRAPAAAGQVHWDPGAPGAGLDPAALEGTQAVLHFAGAPVARRWTAAYKREIRASRVDATRKLTTVLAGLTQRPAVLICASAVGWYGHTGSREVDESAPAGSGFLPELVRDWEAAADPARQAGIRVVHVRSGVVLAKRGGMVGTTLSLFRLGLGARLGSGSQYLSWISLTDEAAAVRFLLDSDDLSGVFNLTAPQPVTNAAYTAALGRAVGRPAFLSVPAPVLRLAAGELAEEILSDVRAVPRRLLDAGYEFRYPDVDAALAAELRR